jgi:hypothetical protein
MKRRSRVILISVAVTIATLFVLLDKGIYVGSNDIGKVSLTGRPIARECRYFSLTGKKSYAFIPNDEPEAACELLAPAAIGGLASKDRTHDIPIRIDPSRLREVQQP